ncbi:TPA: hypothetical protein LTW52_005083 [Escherichia coli]|nr:hypothetical protein [Escherichia coli]
MGSVLKIITILSDNNVVEHKMLKKYISIGVLLFSASSAMAAQKVPEQSVNPASCIDFITGTSPKIKWVGSSQCNDYINKGYASGIDISGTYGYTPENDKSGYHATNSFQCYLKPGVSCNADNLPSGNRVIGWWPKFIRWMK